MHLLLACEVAAPRELLALVQPGLGAGLALADLRLASRELLAQRRKRRDLAGPLSQEGRADLARRAARARPRRRRAAADLLFPQRFSNFVALSRRPYDAKQRAERRVSPRARQHRRQICGLRLRFLSQFPPISPPLLRRLQQQLRSRHCSNFLF